jgi:aryl-alcohol dehydrogenase-like predicted oxidoreductase
VREVVAISREIGCSAAQVAISWVRQQPSPVIPLIAARTEEQFRGNLAAADVRLTRRSPAGWPAPPLRRRPLTPEPSST